MIDGKELYEKQHKAAKAAWEELPEALQDMILTIFHSNGEYGVSDAIRYLSEHKVNSSEHCGTAKLEYLKWVDRVFRDMYPVFNHEDLWENQGKEIEEILARAEGYLRDLAADYEQLSIMSRDEMGFYDSSDLVKIA